MARNTLLTLVATLIRRIAISTASGHPPRCYGTMKLTKDCKQALQRPLQQRQVNDALRKTCKTRLTGSACPAWSAEPTLFWIIFALWAKPRVLAVSLAQEAAGVMFAIITVLALPPRESYSTARAKLDRHHRMSQVVVCWSEQLQHCAATGCLLRDFRA